MISLLLRILSIMPKVYEEFKVNLSRSKVTSILHDLGYSFKKGCSRPMKYKSKHIQILKAGFSVDFLKLLYKGVRIWNVDESSFDRSLRQEYSWLPKGENQPIINSTWVGKCTLILATSSDGKWFGLIKNNIVKSLDFWIFLKLISKIFESFFKEDKVKNVLLIDNAPTHKSKLSTKMMEELKLEVMFLIPYWPEQAPVEKDFLSVKMKMRASRDYSSLNFDKPAAMKRIFEKINEVKATTWHLHWLEAIREARKSILNQAKNGIQVSKKHE